MGRAAPSWSEPPFYAPGRIRTCDFCLRRAALYPLSYGRLGFRELSVGPHAPGDHLRHPHAARQPVPARGVRRRAARGRRDPARGRLHADRGAARARGARPARARRPRQRRRRRAAADAPRRARGRCRRRADRDGARRRPAHGPAAADAGAVQGRGRGRLRPLPSAPPRARRGRLPDLQPRLADRAPSRARAHDGHRHRERRSGGLRARLALGSAVAMDLSLFFAGTAGSVPTARRGLPAMLLRAGGDRLLFDCGEGTQQQLLRSVGLPELDAIFITHYHLDHWLGLLGLLKTFDLRARERPLSIYGPPGLRALLDSMRPAWGRVAYPLALEELDPHEEVAFDGYAVAPFPVEHRVRAYGYAFAEDDRPGRFDAEEAERLGVTPGPDFGRLQNGEIVGGVRPEQVVGEPRSGRRIVISGDTAPCQATEVFAHRADVLVHEATFLDDELTRARDTGHSTARQAAEVASVAEVRLLALTHVSTRYFPRDIRDEARAVFADTIVPRDFDAVEAPSPERGAPPLVTEDPPAPT